MTRQFKQAATASPPPAGRALSNSALPRRRSHPSPAERARPSPFLSTEPCIRTADNDGPATTNGDAIAGHGALDPPIMRASRCLPRRCLPRGERSICADLPATGSAGFTVMPIERARRSPTNRENQLRVVGIRCLVDRPPITRYDEHVAAPPHAAHRSPSTASLRRRGCDNLFALHSNAYVLRYWDAPPWSERVRSRAVHHGLAADGRGGHRGAAGRGSCLRRGVHRLVQP